MATSLFLSSYFLTVLSSFVFFLWIDSYSDTRKTKQCLLTQITFRFCFRTLVLFIDTWTVVNPGFPRRRRGASTDYFGQFVPKSCIKMKNRPTERGEGAPLPHTFSGSSESITEFTADRRCNRLGYWGSAFGEIQIKMLNTSLSGLLLL